MLTAMSTVPDPQAVPGSAHHRKDTSSNDVVTVDRDGLGQGVVAPGS